MEACRPGSDDLEDPALASLAGALAADPELAELFERLGRVDSSLAEAFGDVPLPEGLADRITARLAAANNGQKAAVAGPKPQGLPAEEPRAQPTRPRSRLRRRWVVAGAVVAAVAASVIVAILLPSEQPPNLDPGSIVEEAREFFLDDRDATAQLFSEGKPPDAYPTDPDFDQRQFPQIRWRAIHGFLGRKGVAYDLRDPRTRATLYVVSCPTAIPRLPNAVPRTPISTTGGRAVSAWQRGGLLYVLVIDDSRFYRSFLPSTTFA
jgi:hypothetical protein